MGFIENACPIHRAKDDWFPDTKQHHADGFEWVIDYFHGLDPAAAARVAHRGCDIEPEWGQMKAPRFLCLCRLCGIGKQGPSSAGGKKGAAMMQHGCSSPGELLEITGNDLANLSLEKVKMV
jgi:hypothetical protein